ncbi:MAG TPA: DUF3558 family protein [Candidatus Dormibacteraeota bacterium]
MTVGARGWLAAGALVLALAGCGSSSSTPTPTAAPSTPPGLVVGPARDFGDACRLLTPAEVQSATSVGPVTAGSRKDPQLGSYCTYTPAGGSSVPVLTVQAVVEYTAAAARAMVDQSGGPTLSGVGDDARLARPGGLGSAVYLSKGTSYVVLSSIHKDVTEQELTRLAGTLAGRL